jgi:hypothetical protein
MMKEEGEIFITNISVRNLLSLATMNTLELPHRVCQNRILGAEAGG